LPLDNQTSAGDWLSLAQAGTLQGMRMFRFGLGRSQRHLRHELSHHRISVDASFEEPLYARVRGTYASRPAWRGADSPGLPSLLKHFAPDGIRMDHNRIVVGKGA